jgi:ABC-type bacteriocin/lantibiotic exporter with double-glycine peptidase domain
MLISHKTEYLKKCDKIIIMENGEILKSNS